jgi:LysR family transcriptional regulator, glycine cleavage system transcriptional activator
MRSYIPLNALRAFEAAARHLSFTRAAAELCVTPTAVSHQIRSLEEFLETPLFERKSGKLALTPVTSNALRELSEGFNKLESALQTLNRRGGRRKVSVAASPSVAALWLMPRLPRFFACAPEIDVILQTVIAPSDFSDGAFDVAICCSKDHPGRKVDYLMSEEIVPVCSPHLLAKSGLSREAALSQLPLIHDDKASDFPTWRRYFEATQTASRDVGGGLRFNQSSLAIEAAVKGHGLLLGRSRLIAEALADGRLTVVSDRPYPILSRYYTVRQRAEELSAVRTFLEWLIAEVDGENGSGVEAERTVHASPSFGQQVGVAFGPHEGRLSDIDWRGEKELVGNQGRRVGADLHGHRNAHGRSAILDINGPSLPALELAAQMPAQEWVKSRERLVEEKSLGPGHDRARAGATVAAGHPTSARADGRRRVPSARDPGTHARVRAAPLSESP